MYRLLNGIELPFSFDFGNVIQIGVPMEVVANNYQFCHFFHFSEVARSRRGSQFVFLPVGEAKFI